MFSPALVTTPTDTNTTTNTCPNSSQSQSQEFKQQKLRALTMGFGSEAASSSYLDDKHLFLGPRIHPDSGTHAVMTNVLKSTKKKMINVDTRFGSLDDYKQHFTVHFPDRITDLKSILVKSVELPMSFFNFTMRFGNQRFLVFETNVTTPIIVTLRDQWISTISELCDAVNQGLVDQGLGYEMAISVTPDGNHLEIHNISPTSKSYSLVFYQSTYFPQVDGFQQTLGYFLGFRKSTYDLPAVGSPGYSPGSAVLVGECFPNPSPLRYIYLVVDEIGGGGQVQNSFVTLLPHSTIPKKILARIALDPKQWSFGPSTIMWAGPATTLVSDKREYNGKMHWQKLQIELVNEWGQTLGMQGMDFSFVLECEYE